MKTCKYKELCGGCQLQGIPYEKQLELKQKNVEKLLSSFCNVKRIIGMDNPYNYRNKVQVTFGYDDHHHIICGNYVPSTHTIVPVDDCMISDEKANNIVNSVLKLAIKYKISVFDERAYKGCLRHLLIKTSNLNQIMLVIVTGSLNIYKQELFINDVLKYNPEITTIVQCVNNKRTSMILSDRINILYGKGYIEDELCGLRFQISASSFYQVNKRQTEVLYNEAIKQAKFIKNEIIIDAYCGTGTIGLVASKYVDKVYGVELNKQAIKDAIINKKNNNIKNVDFIADDAGKYMLNLASKRFKVDTVIMDPPRAGSDKNFMNALFTLKPKKIVYVSCNPITLKENLQYLTKKEYEVVNIQPVDMFPFSEHVETIVLLKSK